MMMKEVPDYGSNVDVKTHYCWIKHLSRLLSNQISKHKAMHFFCDRCLNYFQTLPKLINHQKSCFSQNECQIEMPAHDKNTIKFNKYKNQLDCPFIIYADVETILKKPETQFCKIRDGKKPTTTAYQEHEVYSVGYFFHCLYDQSKSFYASERGPSCVEWFVNELKNAAERVAQILNDVKPLKMTVMQEAAFWSQKNCHICEKEFNQTQLRARDHSHITGEFRGAACVDCNLNYVESREIPVVFHNLSHYDSHFILQKLADGFPGDISIIPLNSEKYISFTKTVKNTGKKFRENVKLRFIDSLRFMASSLDELAKLLPAEKKKF